MRHIKARLAWLLPVSLMIAWSALAHSTAPQYRVIDIGTLGGTSSTGTGINDLGQVTGYSTTAGDTATHAFIGDTHGGAPRDLGTLPGGTDSYGYAINRLGQVTGYASASTTAEPGYQSFAFISAPNGGALTAIDRPVGQGVWTVGYGINAGGRVSGVQTVGGINGSWGIVTGPNGTPLRGAGTLGGTFFSDSFTVAYGINAVANVTGYSVPGPGDWGGKTCSIPVHAFISDPHVGPLFDLGTLGGIRSEGTAVNVNGQVTGYSTMSGGVYPDCSTPDTYHAFIASGHGLVDLGTLPGLSCSYGWGINDLGVVVGSSSNGTSGVCDYPSHTTFNAYRGFVYINGIMYNLNARLAPIAAAHIKIQTATGINKKGWIVANGTDSHTGQTHAFVLIPRVTAAQQLAELGSDVPNDGTQRSLASKVRLAQTYLAANDIGATCSILEGFVREVRLQAGTAISSEVADGLIEDAGTILGGLKCH